MKTITFYLSTLLLVCNAFSQTVTLKNGSIIKGEITTETADFVEIKTSYAALKINKSEIDSLEYGNYTVKLKDGNVLNGRVLEKTASHIKMLISGNEALIPTENISSLEPQKTNAVKSSTTAIKQSAVSIVPISTSQQAITGISSSGQTLSDAVSLAAEEPSLGTLPAKKASGFAAGSSNISNEDSVSIVDLTTEDTISKAGKGAVNSVSQINYLVTLKSGRQVSGKIMDMGVESVTILTSEGEKRLLRNTILSIVVQENRPSFTAQNKKYKPTHLVNLTSGASMECVLVEDGPEKIKILTEYGINEISKSAVSSIERLGKETAEVVKEKIEISAKKNRKKKEKDKKELTFFIGIWKPPFKLNLEAEGGPNSIALDSSGVTYGMRYMFKKVRRGYIGIEGALQSVSNKTIDFENSSTTAKISGEAGYLQARYLFGNIAKIDRVYFAAGLGLSFSKVSYKITESSTTTSTSVTSTQPIVSLLAGINKKVSSSILGFEAGWSYAKQKAGKLSGSSSGFLSAVLKISWVFD